MEPMYQILWSDTEQAMCAGVDVPNDGLEAGERKGNRPNKLPQYKKLQTNNNEQVKHNIFVHCLFVGLFVFCLCVNNGQ